MFQINEDKSIYATRGDIVFFAVTAEDADVPHQFQAGDVVRIKIFGKKKATDVVLQKDFPVVEESDSVDIFLDKEDTKIGDVLNKPKDYWYEVELNPFDNPQTIIGYDEDGPKVFKLFPEGADVTEYVPTPEDIPFVDEELDMTSSRPVQNQAIARELTRVSYVAETAVNKLAEEKKRLDNLIEHNAPTLNQALDYLYFISEETRMKVDGEISSDGVFATIKVNWREANMYYGGTLEHLFYLPNECRPMETGVVHSEDDIDYVIQFNPEDENRYVLCISVKNDASVVPSSAGVVTFSYPLSNYEVKDIRVGADGVTYPTAGEAVRKQFEAVNALLAQIMESLNIDKG